MSVFVTVGTTSFDALIEAVTDTSLLKVLQSCGYKKIIIQRGRGKYEVESSSQSQLDIEVYRYKDAISEDIKNSSLVISHAGAGTCLEVLEANRPLIVVVNETLMNNHQFELAKQLNADGHLLFCTCSSLLDTLKTMDLSSLSALPPPNTMKFVEHLSSFFGIS